MLVAVHLLQQQKIQLYMNFPTQAVSCISSRSRFWLHAVTLFGAPGVPPPFISRSKQLHSMTSDESTKAFLMEKEMISFAMSLCTSRSRCSPEYGWAMRQSIVHALMEGVDGQGTSGRMAYSKVRDSVLKRIFHEVHSEAVLDLFHEQLDAVADYKQVTYIYDQSMRIFGTI